MVQDIFSEIKQFNPLSAEYKENPWSLYKYYLENDPVHWGLSPDSSFPGSWFLFSYKDVFKALSDPRLSKDKMRFLPAGVVPTLPDAMRPAVESFSKFMLFRDPPDHTRLRSLVVKAFTPRIIEKLRPEIVAIANSLLDPVQSGGKMDLMADFAVPLPVIVIAELLGVKKEDRDKFKDWSKDLAAAVERPQPDIIIKASKAVLALNEYLTDVIEDRKRHPQEDLISNMIASEETGGKLTHEELLANCILILVAGHETTVNLIGNGVLSLLQNPEQYSLLKENPDLLHNAVEELLRYNPSVQAVTRYGLEDLEIGGKLIRRGERIAVFMASANRDPEQFYDPDRLDLGRKPNKHSSFGFGIHFCLGSALARLEGEIAVSTLMKRVPHLSLTDEALEWQDMVNFRGLKKLPVTF